MQKARRSGPSKMETNGEPTRLVVDAEQAQGIGRPREVAWLPPLVRGLVPVVPSGSFREFELRPLPVFDQPIDRSQFVQGRPTALTNGDEAAPSRPRTDCGLRDVQELGGLAGGRAAFVGLVVELG